MERDRTTDSNGTKRGQDRLRAWLLAGASAAALPGGGTSAWTGVGRRACLPPGGAGARTRGRSRVAPPGELHPGRVRGSGGVDRRGAAGRGRLAGGLDGARAGGPLLRRHAAGLPGARRAKGVGRDHRAVHAAPHAYAGNGETPVLHWLENGAAQGGVGRASVTLPACLSDAAAGGPLPTGRAALAGTVRDPYWTLLTKVETSCDRILIAGGANVEAEWEQGPAV